MGRRKIEIKAIKDDRNRSVTFLKRKGGLFKKAHELSILCSVDVAVIIFGHNKKLYEFSSGDINETIGRYQYYGGAHEHKGPEDFMGKKDMDDEDDEEGETMGSPPRESHTPPAMMGHPLHSNPSFQHIRHATPSASPPIGNGVPFHARHPSPQPGTVSRPDSRAQMRRPSSHLVPPQQHLSQPPPPQNSYAYMPNPPFYNPQAAQNMAPRVSQGPPPPQFQYTHPPPTHPQIQYMQQEQRRQSLPPALQQQVPQQQPQQQPPPQERPQQQPQPPHVIVPSPPQQEQNHFQSPPLPQPKPLPAAAKHSIFTPIDDSRSMLAWGSISSETPRSESTMIKSEGGTRSQSIDVAVMTRPPPNNRSPPQPFTSQAPTQLPQRTQFSSSVPPVAPPSRTNSMAKNVRPSLKVQIPSEHSDGGSQTAESSPRDSGNTGATPARTSTDASHSSGMVLPPPSPSANSLLSAGATGPPNPFARPPPPPTNNGSYGSRNEMETPMSALPSRFVENGLLPSPSSFYPEWGFGRESNMLPSPLTFQTPVVANGPSFSRDDPADRKRKTSDEGSSEAENQKRVKA